MLSIVTGPFHPDLEAGLVSQIRTLKQSDPLAPVAIIAPSQQLARRVKWLLAVEQGIALLDVHVLTFHHLAMTLIEEQGGKDRPTLVNIAFREELLRYLVDRGIPGAESFQGLRRMKGLWAALWATIQDLKEARVDAEDVLSALVEGRLSADGSPRLAALLQLQAAVLEVDKALRLADPDDLAAVVAENASESAFLNRMKQVCYYGFYDLTQGQLDLFRTVCSTHPTTVFFPLRTGSPAYLFAGRFFAAHIQGLSGAVEGAGLSGPHDGAGGLADEMLPSVRGTCRIVSTVGPEEEVSAAAKEILHLIEDHGFEPTEIGVVARTLDPYGSIVRRVFEENRIPFACSIGTPLIEEPLVKTIIKFLRLPLESFPRAGVIDVLSSPALRFDSTVVGGDVAETVLRPDLWDWATRRLGIVRVDAHDGGLGDWRRLEKAVKQGLDSARDNAEPLGHSIPVAQLAVLFQLIERLHGDLSALPISGGWSEYTDAFLRLLPAYFDLPGWSDREPATAPERVEVAVRDCLNSVKALDQLDEHISLPDWVVHIVRVFERSRVPSGENDLPGVRCMDAMDARGMTFRAVFVLGLNEKVFPRSVHEDAFLRDEDREVLSRDLGYKIARKLEGFDEERLLFALVLRSARERLYLSYQRADRKGRPMAPSGYLAEVMTGVSEPVWLIKRRPMDRWSERPFAQGPSDWTVLTPREASLQLILGGGKAGVDRLLRLYQSPEWFAEGMQAVAHIDSLKPLLTPYDGLVGAGRPHWGAVEQRGVSPSALEHYAQCPFRYFAVHLLRLDQMEAPETVIGLDARARGLLCHDILKEFYEGFRKRGASPVEASQAEVDAGHANAAAGAFARYEATEPVGYPLLWTLTKEGLLRLTRSFLHDDLEELRASGYIPTFFELPVQGEFGTALPGDLRHVPIRGRMDRVDVRRDEGVSHVRVVDYKYTESKSSKKEDRDLITAAVRGMRLQPPLYLLAAAGVLEGQPTVVDASALYFLAPRWEDGPVVRTQVTVPCGGDSMREILDGVRSGRFFILPDDYCDRCEFASMCRRSHHPTRWRRRDDAHKARLLAMRKQTGNENRDDD